MFKIKMPDGHTKIMRYNRETLIEEKMGLVRDHILDRWEDSFRNYWLSSTSVKSVLDKCATFILLGNSKDAGILTSYKIDKVNTKEIPASNANDNAGNLIYGDYNPSADNASGFADATLTTQEPSIDLAKVSDSKLKKEEEKEEKRLARWKTSKSRKLYKLFSTPELKTYKMKRVKATEYMFGKVGEEMSLVREETGAVKNVFGQAVFMDESTTIGGNKGYNRSSTKTKWCLVDTDNVFTFEGKRYKISDKVSQYKVGKDNEAEMDMILVILTESEIKFYDMNVDEIDSKFVSQI